ncbi:hypothetical protein EXS70_03865 [Candidatus Peribacteria bacterium]|nr:hypothetical protein [Candidatus Peribacteria bacterium]
MSVRTFLFLVAILLAVPGVAKLQAPGPQLIPDTGAIGSCNFVTGDFGFDCIPLYMTYLIRLAFSLAGGFAVFQIVQGGYEYAFSGLQQFGGLPDKEAGKKRITNAIIGLVVVVFTYLIIDTLVSVIFSG